ncbi:MAG: putative DNA binding domain-containing protein [Anaerolineae bacterium]|nr:putative DNA binding domain-containing protein [Anaerolineae bacterium]
MTQPSSRRKTKSARQWRRVDLHLHTPASNDYQEPHVTYLDILRQAERRGLDIIALTDHNTVMGCAALKREFEQLLFLEQINRLELEEKRRLDEFRYLLGKILVLPGFEFTATFGFHIIGIFPPETPISYLEHLLLTLHVPVDKLAEGSTTVGATADVLTAYRVIDEAGGIAIAAHANSGNGVAMRGFPFGGQTKIAYTQDPHLHLLEVTDLEKRGRLTTANFFNGSKPEYPRAMRCIQGSDAHRLTRDPNNIKYLGVGDRATEVLLEEVSFAALATVLKGNDLSLTRPFRGKATPVDFVQAAREEGPSIVQAFHPQMTQRGGYLTAILRDVCAMANSNGGTIYIGVSANAKEKPVGVKDHEKVIRKLQEEIAKHISPEPPVLIDSLPSQGERIVRIIVPVDQDLPYALDSNQFFIRDEAETQVAVRDEIVRLVERRLRREGGGVDEGQMIAAAPPRPLPILPPTPEPATIEIAPPRTGVEVVESQKRSGTVYHTLRDLRNGSLIKNVTQSSARKLWHYAIQQAEAGGPKLDSIRWQGGRALLNRRSKDGNTWYDLALRDPDGTVHIYYGVTDSGLDDGWLKLIEPGE